MKSRIDLKCRTFTYWLMAFLFVISSFGFGFILLASAENSAVKAIDDLGNWTNYNGIVFGDAVLHDSGAGGALAVKGSIEVNDNNFTIGSTYSAVYNSTQHIGEFKNEGGYPAFLFGGRSIEIGTSSDIDVLGGDIAMTEEMRDVNAGLNPKFIPGVGSSYRTLSDSVIHGWFDRQYEIAKATAELFSNANDVEIDINDFAGGSYRNAGPEHYKNEYLTVDGVVYDRALFITVRTAEDVDFGQWWPIYSVIHFDVNWAINYDLVVFNFPDAVNVTMNSSTFFIDNTTHWSTTVDAWIGQQGMVERLALAEKVVYNFPAARNIEATRTLIQGTILAPDAVFIGIGAGDEGHIYGHLVVNEYIAEANFTIHAFRLSNWAYDIVEEKVEPEVLKSSIALQQFLYFNGAGRVPIAGGGYILTLHDSGHTQYFNGSGFSNNIQDATVYVPSDTGYVVIEDVPLGSYVLQNVSAPDGFRVNDSVPTNGYTYYRHPVEVKNPENAVQVTRYVAPEVTDVSFVKLDSDTRQGLEGAAFALIREADEYLDQILLGEYISAVDGRIQINALPVGEYHLVEIETPAGYEFVDGGELYFRIYWDTAGSLLRIEDINMAPLYGTQLNPIEIENEIGIPQNSVTVVKYSYNESNPSDTSHTLAGAEFDLFVKNEADVWESVTVNALGEPVNIRTNQQGYYRIHNLHEGTYRLVEKKASPGYRVLNEFVDEDFPNGYAYEFSFNGMASAYTAYLPNERLRVDITIRAMGTLLGARRDLSNCSFKLEHLMEDGKTWEELEASVTTDNSGQVVLNGIAAGSYRITQLRSHAGYHPIYPSAIAFELEYGSENLPLFEAFYNGAEVLFDSYPVSVDTSNEIVLTIENEAKTRGFVVHKVDNDYIIGQDENGNTYHKNTYLEGAVFRLQRMNPETSAWEDYGDAFVSEFYYNAGEPLLDQYGSHIAKAVFEGGLIYGNYRLIEIKTPEGYTTSSTIAVILNDGTQGYAVNQFTVSEASTGIGETTTHVVANYIIMKTTDFIFRKIDMTDNDVLLKSAEFAVYSCKKRHIHDPFAEEDTCWQYDMPLLAESDANGIVEFKELLSGEYRLVETRAPAGYQLPFGQWSIVVDAYTDEITFRAVDVLSVPAFIKSGEEEVVKYLLPNQKTMLLPLTSGIGGEHITLTGIVLVIGAVIVLAFNKIKQKNLRRKSK